MSSSATWGVVPQGAILKIPRKRGADYLSGSVIQRKSSVLMCGVHVATGKRVLARISPPEVAWKVISLPSSSASVLDRSTEWVTTATAMVTYGWWSEEFARMRSTKLWLTHKKGRTSQLAKLLKELADANVPVPKQPDGGDIGDIDEVAITFLTHEIREIASRMRGRTKRVAVLAREYSAKWNSQR